MKADSKVLLDHADILLNKKVISNLHAQ